MPGLCLRRFTIPALIWALSALWLLEGCAGLQKTYEPPRVTLSNMMIQEAKALETAFLIELRVFNANDVPPFPLTLKENWIYPASIPTKVWKRHHETAPIGLQSY